VKIGPDFEELYRREHATVFRAVFALCGHRAVAEDSTQEAFARALERWRRLENRPWVAGWITTTALNAARRALRRRSADPAPRGDSEADVESAVDVWAAVRRLPHRQQEAVVLFYVIDLPVAGVAEAMRCSEGTAKTHLVRAREALRKQLEGVRDE
jgi:RNA polymerase sigma-70 factor (ECF subfamily)